MNDMHTPPRVSRFAAPRSEAPALTLPPRPAPATIGTTDEDAPAERRPSRRASRLVAISPRGGMLLAIATAVLLFACVSSNLVGYVTNGGGLDELVLAAALIGLAAAINAPPRAVGDIGVPMGIFMALVILSLRHEWVGTPIIDIARATAIVLMAGLLFFTGVSLRQRVSAEWLGRLQWLAIALFAIVVLVATIVFSIQKNVVGGTMFELAFFALTARYLLVGRLDWQLGLMAGGAIIVGGFLCDHRVMMAIGAAVGAVLVVLSLYRPGWLRLMPPLGALVVGIFAIIALTQLTHTSAMAQVDQEVKASTGRTALSGRQDFWGPVVDAIVSGPLSGYGPTKLARDVTGLQFSTHNAFLQVGLNFGLLGIAASIVILIMLARRAALAPVTSAGAILSTYIMAVIVHNSSENVLFQNNFPIAAMTWINMGLLAASCTMPPLGNDDGPRSIFRLSPRR